MKNLNLAISGVALGVCVAFAAKWLGSETPASVSFQKSAAVLPKTKAAAPPQVSNGQKPMAAFQRMALAEGEGALIPQPNANSSALKTLSPEEMASARFYGELLKASIEGHLTTESLKMKLKSQGLVPDVSRSGNAQDGFLTILRTTDAIPGTRYFHSQFFEEAQPKIASSPQPVSFEIRAGPDSFVKANEIALSVLPKGSELMMNKPGYRLWKTPNDQIVWIKVLNSADLKNNPYNAYSSEDVGSVRVVTEDEIH